MYTCCNYFEHVGLSSKPDFFKEQGLLVVLLMEKRTLYALISKSVQLVSLFLFEDLNNSTTLLKLL